MKTVLKRVVFIVVATEIFYLALVNLVLNLGLTQDLINKIKPDKFYVSWDSAWTPYPFRVYAKGVAANGQSAGQQWQAGSTAVSASISLTPLIRRTVSLSNIKVLDVEYRQRPRPGPDRDFADTRDYFPAIDGRQLEPRAAPATPATKTSTTKARKSWNILIDDIYASGSHKVWLYQAQAILNGELQAELTVQTRGGPISLSNGELDITLESLVLNGNREVSRQTSVKGKVTLLPVVIRQNKGIKVLEFVNVDVTLDAETESLAFLNLYLGAFNGMKVDGAGKVAGRINLGQGELLPGSDLNVSARELGLDLFDYRVEGAGNIRIGVPEENAEVIVTIDFGSLNAYLIKNREPLIEGEGLAIEARGSPRVIPLDGRRPTASYLALTIPSVKVPDLNAYQRLLPNKWALMLYGGEGELQGQAKLSSNTFDAEFRLTSEDADVGFRDFRFGTSLDTAIKINSPSLESGKVDVSGTFFKLQGAKLSNEEEQSDAWQASIVIEKGVVDLNLGEADENVTDDGETGVSSLRQSLAQEDLGSLLAASDEELKISGSISDLRWLNLLLKNPYNLAISGNGDISADIVVTSGWLGKGTNVTIDPENMVVDVLDYQATGGGGLEIKVVKGGEFPDIALNIAVTDAQFGRKSEEQAFIEDVDITLQALARNVKLEGTGGEVELRLKIPSARILDMSVYNQYLPEDSPLQVLGGEASLEADILLKPDDADGYVLLTTQGLRSRVDDQDISGELTASIKLVGGTPKDMEFDISGSSLRLDGVKVVGEEAEFSDEDWAAVFNLSTAKVVWRKPIELDLESKLSMTDSMPIVSMLANQQGRESWLGKILTIDDVSGEASLQMSDNRIVIPYAFAGSEKIDVGAKAVISKDSRNGVLYVRYGVLRALLEIKDGDRNIDILNTRGQFDQYSTNAVMESRMDDQGVSD